jgi:GTPase SAR1 family protein
LLQVLGFVDKRSPELDLVLVDTPGQIEIFTWSASGQIISESLAATYPTVVLYVVDTPRTTSPVTFMSNMLYAVSIMYKAKLPFLLVFNKTDVTSHDFAKTWMEDMDAFTAALKSDESYMSSLTRSMALVLDEFYAAIRVVGVSAMTGEGMPELFAAIKDLSKEYEEVYAPALAAQKADVAAKAAQRKEKQMQRMARDLAADEAKARGENVVLQGAKKTAAAAKSGSKSQLRPLPGSDGIIQQRPQEPHAYVRHPDEEAADELDSDDGAPDVGSDEEDAEHALPYDEDDREEYDEDEYVSTEARAADQEEFEQFMARIRGEQGGTGAGAASGSGAARGAKAPIAEEDEGAEEIEAGKKR